MSMRFAKIMGVRSAVPSRRLSNEELAAEFPEWNVAKIYEKTGIHTRCQAGPAECSSDLGVEAARKLFDDGLAQPGDIDFLLFCTQSPDYFLPTTACLVQQRLGLPTSCGALDFNLGCSGYVYGLSLAKGLIETGQADNVLLITAETYSKFLHPKDKGVRTIFGDGAAVTLVQAIDGPAPWLGPFVFGTDGRGARNLIVQAGGKRLANGSNQERRPDSDPKSPGPEHLFMNGPEIFAFTLRAVPPLVREVLERANLTADEVDHFLLHQANSFMLDALRVKLGLPDSKVGFHLKDVGNTVSATIPMTLELLQRQETLRQGSRVLLVGFGVGYSWAGCVACL
jgi:3-oxoacyl-[acyl-carrier-protein] synthase-3